MEHFKNYKRMIIGSWSEANKLGNGTYVKSDRFNAGGHSWRIAFYPHGRLAGTTASMSIFLLLDDDDNVAGGGTAAAAAADEDAVQVKFSFTMGKVYGLPVFMSGTVAAAFCRRSNAHGFERFVLRDDFEKTVLFKRDQFEIQCSLTVFPVGSERRAAVQMSRSGQPDPPLVVQAPPPPPASPEPSVVGVPPSAPLTTPTPSVVRVRVPAAAASPKPSVVTATLPPESATPVPSVTISSVPPPSIQPEPLFAAVSGSPASVPVGQKGTAPPLLSGLSADLGRLLATKEGADVALEVRGKVFAAHKAVLAARSPVFMEELFGPAKEEDMSYVRFIPDMSPESFEAMLHYLYTDTLPPEMTMNSADEGAVIRAEDLLAAADRYELKDLKLQIQNKLCNNVGMTTVLPMLGLAEHH